MLPLRTPEMPLGLIVGMAYSYTCFSIFNRRRWPTILALFSLEVLKVFIDSFIPSRSTASA